MQNDKKILIFSTSYFPLVGGAEVAVREITDRLPQIQFDLITAKQRKNLPFKEKVGNVTVYRLGIGIPLIDKLIIPFEGALFARHLAKSNKYDAFWCVMATFSSGAAYIYNIFSKIKIPIVLTLQEGDSERHFQRRWFGLINFSWKLALQRAKFVTVISNYLAKRARDFGYKGELEVIPNGVDIAKFAKEIPEEERKEIRRVLGLKEDDIALVTSSRLNIKNGIEDVLKALTHLPADVKFVVFGVGELEAKLKKLAEDINVNDRVIWRGFIPHNDLPNILKSCDIFIRASLSEGLGNSFLEAMVARIPVIASPVGGIPDFLQDGETGYFCDPSNPESVAEAVKRVINDGKKEEVLENAYKMVKEKYNWDKISIQMKGVFDSL